MSTKVLLTGGRAPATLDLARQFHKQGYTVYVAESEPNYVSRRSNVFAGKFIVAKPNVDHTQFVADILSICLANEITTCIPTCEETFHLAKAMDQFRAHGIRLFTSTIDVLNELHNKFRFIELAKALGLPAPASYEVSNRAELEGARARVGGACVLKPVYSRFSESVHVLEVGEPTPVLPLTSDQTWVVQQRIRGTQHCSYSITHHGKLTAHGCYATEFAYGHATVYFASVEHPGIQAFVEKIVAHLGFTGQISFDFIVQDDGTFYPIECNPRTTSGVHLFGANAAFPHTFFVTHGDKVERPTLAAPRMLGVAILRLVGAKPGALRAFWRGRDVVWHVRDPLPAFDQLLIFATFFIRAFRQRKTLTSLLTEDIQWGGE